MGEYCFYVVEEDVKAEDFLNELAKEECVEVRLQGCVIEGEVDIAISGIPFDKNEKYSINKAIICRNCTFKQKTDFTEATFKQKTDFTEATFSQNANFSRTTFIQLANFRNATFSGEADFISTKSECADFRNATFSGEVYFSDATFSEWVNFRAATFNDSTNFRAATFSQDANKSIGEANFRNATFSGEADFISAKFGGDADFSDATFSQDANFSSAEFKTPASFYGVKYVRNTFFQYLLRRNPTQFYMEDKDISAISNPSFKRYVADQQYIRAFRETHPLLAELWRWSSDYGRSFGLWAFWSVLFAGFFGCAYAHELWWNYETIGVVLVILGGGLYTGIAVVLLLCESATVKKIVRLIGQYIFKRKWRWSLPILILLGLLVLLLTVRGLDFIISNTGDETRSDPTFITFLYFSIVTFTTLGFGDVTPKNTISEMWLMAEVILGYVMLGGLISIFANKLARRS